MIQFDGLKYDKLVKPTLYGNPVSGPAQNFEKIHVAIFDAAKEKPLQRGSPAYPAFDCHMLFGIERQTGCPSRNLSKSDDQIADASAGERWEKTCRMNSGGARKRWSVGNLLVGGFTRIAPTLHIGIYRCTSNRREQTELA